MPFKRDGAFFVFLGHVASFIIINLLFIVCCIPIITAGPALCALHHSMMKLYKKEPIHPFFEFFRSFKNNLKQGCIIQAIVLVISIFLFLDLRYTIAAFGSNRIAQIASIFFMMIAFVFLLMLTLLYPIQAQFSNTLKDTFKNALLLSLSHLPFCFIMMLLNLLPIILLMIWLNGFLFMLPFYIFIGFSVTSFLNCFFIKKIFQPYMPEEPVLEEDSIIEEK